MELKSRQVYILKLAIDNPEGYPLQELMRQTGLTRRTLSSDFVQINDWLKNKKTGELFIESKTMKLRCDRVEKLKNELQKRENIFYSIEERRTIIILYILLADRPVTLERLGLLLDVSKNTILTDIKEVREQLQKEGVQIVSTIKGGYELQGEEIIIRKCIGNRINGLRNTQTQGAIRKILQNTLCSMTEQQLDYEQIVREMLRSYEADERVSLALESEKNDISMILVSCIRSRKGCVVKLNEKEQRVISATRAYRFLCKKINELKNYDLVVPESEIFYMATILLGIKMEQFLSKGEEDLYICRYTASLIRNYENAACAVLENREQLAKRLQPHIHSLYYRLKYGIQYANPQIEDVQRMYPEIYTFVKRAVNDMPEELSKELTEVELSYITVYFVSEEKNEAIMQPQIRGKILVFCAAGVATSTLIKKQVKELLEDMVEIEVGSLKEIERYQIDKYALVISTTPLDVFKQYSNVLFTGIVLNEKEKETIIRILGQKGIAGEYDQLIKAIIREIKKNVVGKLKENELYFSILRILYEEKMKPDKTFLSFSQLIQDGQYQILPAKSSICKLLELGCSSVCRSETAQQHCYARLEPAFQRRCMKYYKIMDNVVLFHCPLMDELKENINFSIVVSEEKIYLNEGVEGAVFIFFATIDGSSHFPLLKKLYDYCDSDEGRTELRGIQDRVCLNS